MFAMRERSSPKLGDRLSVALVTGSYPHAVCGSSCNQLHESVRADICHVLTRRGPSRWGVPVMQSDALTRDNPQLSRPTAAVLYALGEVLTSTGQPRRDGALAVERNFEVLGETPSIERPLGRIADFRRRNTPQVKNGLQPRSLDGGDADGRGGYSGTPAMRRASNCDSIAAR
jgi:hypothetical protein